MSADTPPIDLSTIPPWEVLPEQPPADAAHAASTGAAPARKRASRKPSAAAPIAASAGAACDGAPPTSKAKIAAAKPVKRDASAASEALADPARHASQALQPPVRRRTASVQALDPLTLPLTGSRLIEASAGTGKTYTIAQLYVRLVLGHGTEDSRFARALTPPEILVVTFTDAATQELRDRIRQRLGQAAAVFEDDHPEWVAGQTDLLALRAQYTPEQWPGCAKLLRVAADWMDEAAVSTIHSWCYRMLREHAFDSGNLFTQTLITDESEMRLEAARDYWRRNFYDLTHLEAQTLSKIMDSPETLAQEVKHLLVHSDSQWQFGDQPIDADETPLAMLRQYSAAQAQLQALQDEARALWQQDLAAIEALFLNWQGSFVGRSFTPEQMQGWVADMRAWSEGEPEPTGTGKKKIAYFGMAYMRSKYGAGAVPELPAFHAIDVWQDAVRDSASQINEKQLLAQLLAHATRAIQAALDQEKRRRAELSFDDVLRRLHSALTSEHGEGLAARIREQFPVAMIDEFQDTDPIQWTMFDRVYGASSPEHSVATDRALLLIGDPKQAIYGFRGADIHTYLEARQATHGRHYSLATNFRSTHALVAGVNHVFNWAETQWPEAAFRFAPADGAAASGADDDNPMPFVPVAAKGRRERLVLQGQPAAALNWWWLAPTPQADAAAEDSAGGEAGTLASEAPTDEPKPRKASKKGGKTAVEDGVKQNAYRAQMAEACASQMAQWLAAVPEGKTGFALPDGRITPLRPRDMAVLVRSRTEADAIRRALSARGIASAYLSERESVFESVEAQDFSVWLEAVHSDGQGSRLRAALATASLGRSHAWLERLNQDEVLWDEQVVRFRGYNKIWREHGVLPMTRALLHDFALPSAWLALPNGARTLTNVLHLAEWLQKQAPHFDSQQALMRELLRQLDQAGEASDAARLRLESDDDLIKVVTIHKSKGLEYPLVFLPFIAGWANVPNQRKSMVLPAHEAGAPRRVNLDVNSEADKALEALERQREDLRLLYVAMTRARHAMWLGVAPLCSGRAKSCEIEKGALGYLLGGTQGRTADGLYASLQALTQQANDAGAAAAPDGADGPDGPDTDAAWPSAPVMALGNMPPITDTHWQPPSVSQVTITRAPPRVHWRRWWVASYSAMTHGLQDEDSRPEPAGTEAPEPLHAPRAVAPEPESVASEHLHEALLEAAVLADADWSVPAQTTGHTYGDEGDAPAVIVAPTAPPQGVHAFFRGATAGTFWHELLEICAMQGFARMLAEPDKLHDLVQRRASVLGWEAHAPALTQWVQGWLQAPIALSPTVVNEGSGVDAQYGVVLGESAANSIDTGLNVHPGHDPRAVAGQSTCLKDLGVAQARPEMEFLLPVNLANSGKMDQLVRRHIEPGHARPALEPTWLNGMLKGFMDLVFEAPAPDGTPRFYVLDYKSNWLGPDDSHYHPKALRDAALKNRYDLQGALYQLALHRLLRTRLGSGYDPQRHLGGSITWFLRGVGQVGCGVWVSQAPLALLDGLDALLEGHRP